MPKLSEHLASYHGSGYVLAPAGFGKTYLIAQAVSHSEDKQLVLTHTYAGVNALRRKMRKLRVRNTIFQIDTIASWALRVSLAYSGTSGWGTERPADNEKWTELYRACADLLDCAFMRRIIRASYAGLYVDEYQDCSTAQHAIVLKLARDIPCRVLGDPLQGIFDFAGQTPVQWERDIVTSFERLGELDTPHRWNLAGATTLGTWLHGVRQRLEAGDGIDLSANLPATATWQRAGHDDDLTRIQGNICRYFTCDRDDTVIAIHKGSQEYKTKCHTLARNVAGKFSSIEEVEGKGVFSFIDKIDGVRRNATRLKRVITFAKKCMTDVTNNLPAATQRGEPVAIRANTRNPELAKCANAYLADPTSIHMSAFLSALKGAPGVKVIRADLFNRAMGVLRKHALNPQLTLTEVAEKYHGEFRHKGRPVGHRKLIGTTLLVKGLEFDHSIVLDATSLSKKELYVALTRGAKSLTIISTNAVLNPQDQYPDQVSTIREEA